MYPSLSSPGKTPVCFTEYTFRDSGLERARHNAAGYQIGHGDARRVEVEGLPLPVLTIKPESDVAGADGSGYQDFEQTNPILAQ